MYTYFSPSLLRFYSGKENNLPFDVFPMLESEREELDRELKLQNKLLGVDSEGRPIALEQPKFVLTWNIQRDLRNNLLKETDWTQLSDVSTEIKQKYLKYRQELRDITKTFADPNDVVWPTLPE